MTVMEKRVDESAVRIACRWMNYQADWFIDNRQILVLVKNMKGNLLRKDLGRSRLRDHHGDTVTRHHSGLASEKMNSIITTMQKYHGNTGRMRLDKQLCSITAIGIMT